ncbi:MAG: DNA-processing protein DprA, partial [Acetatifactor sp.]|nr:DNA-processing protein DprA [Acetatifactor sp.]
LADALIVVEEREKRGTLLTVEMEKEQGNDLYIVHGRVTDRLSDGCNRLIKQGAGVFLSPEDFLRELRQGWQYGQGRSAKQGVQSFQEAIPGRLTQLSDEYREVYDALDFAPLSIEQIRERLAGEYSGPELMTVLMGLCVEKLVVQRSPGQFCLRGRAFE